VLQEEIGVVGAGRTDAGVHASQMFAHFDVATPLQGDCVHKFNAVLPKDIVVHTLKEVAPEAHARFDAVSRSYEYKIWLGRNPFLLESSWQIHSQTLDIELMNTAAKELLVHTDFQCFSKVKTAVHTFNCTVTNAKWAQKGNELTFYISANRFLRNMVRAIVGTLVDVGLEKITVADFKEIIERKSRENAGLSVPAKGLFLTEVTY